MTQTKLSGKSEMKGKNGYFKLDSLWTADLEGNDPHEPGAGQPVQIDFYSKRAGDAPPSRLLLTWEDLDKLRDALEALSRGHQAAQQAPRPEVITLQQSQDVAKLEPIARRTVRSDIPEWGASQERHEQIKAREAQIARWLETTNEDDGDYGQSIQTWGGQK